VSALCAHVVARLSLAGALTALRLCEDLLALSANGPTGALTALRARKIEEQTLSIQYSGSSQASCYGAPATKRAAQQLVTSAVLQRSIAVAVPYARQQEAVAQQPSREALGSAQAR
jgi:hypothetical protein